MMRISWLEGEIHGLKLELAQLEDSVSRLPVLIETSRQERPDRVPNLELVHRLEDERLREVEHLIRDRQALLWKRSPGGWFWGPHSVPLGFWVRG